MYRELKWSTSYIAGQAAEPLSWDLDFVPTDEDWDEYDSDDDLEDAMGVGWVSFRGGKWRIGTCYGFIKGMEFDDVNEAKAVFVALVRTAPIEAETDCNAIREMFEFEPYDRWKDPPPNSET